MNYRKLIGIALLAAVMGCASGCGTVYTARFSPPVMQETKIILKENDFKINERNLTGDYAYWSIYLGMFPVAAVQIPLDDPRLFSKALANMYGKARPSVEGKSTQLVNWTLDQYDFFLPIPYVSPVRRSAVFRADLMEYTK